MHDVATKEDFRAALKVFELRVALMIGIMTISVFLAVVLVIPSLSQ